DARHELAWWNWNGAGVRRRRRGRAERGRARARGTWGDPERRNAGDGTASRTTPQSTTLTVASATMVGPMFEDGRAELRHATAHIRISSRATPATGSGVSSGFTECTGAEQRRVSRAHRATSGGRYQRPLAARSKRTSRELSPPARLFLLS